MRLTIDQYYVQMLDLVASRSTCPRGRVGAIITNWAGQVLSTGYNGSPSGWPHCIDCVSAGENPGHEKRCHAVHAEVNAILQLGGNGGPQTIYVSKVPCFYCALIIVSTQIKAVVCFEHEGMAKDGAKVLAKADILYLWDKEKQHAQKIAF